MSKRKRMTSGFNTTNLQRTVEKLRAEGFKPLYHRTEGVDWRRVKNNKLHVAEVTVHSSGRVTVHYRSQQDGKA